MQDFIFTVSLAFKGFWSLYLMINHKEIKFVSPNYKFWHTKNQEWKNGFTFTCVVWFFLWRKYENISNFSVLILPLVLVFHDFFTTTLHNKLKLNFCPAHLWYNLSIDFEIKCIPCVLKLFCACQQPVCPTPLLTKTWSNSLWSILTRILPRNYIYPYTPFLSVDNYSCPGSVLENTSRS